MGMKRRGKGVTMLEGGGGDVRACSISSREVAESSICYGQKRVNAWHRQVIVLSCFPVFFIGSFIWSAKGTRVSSRV